jgi:photosystem II stability/assembly factor-like uncharacterized protein
MPLEDSKIQAYIPAKLIMIIALCLNNLVWGQSSPGPKNFELRNADFQTRRQSLESTSFAVEYYKSYQQALSIKAHNKTSDQWIPKGPFGREKLEGIGRINTFQVHPTDTSIWFACVAQGGLWKTTNSGQSWFPLSNDLPILRTSYLAIDPKHPDTMYIALGDYAYLGHNIQANENKRNSHYGLGVYKTTDGGSSWFPTGLSFEQTDFEGSLICRIIINPNDPSRLLAFGQTGCYYSSNGGSSWIRTHNGLFWDAEIHDSQPNTVYASTGYVHSHRIGQASILKSTDFGATWSKAHVPFTPTLEAQRIEIAIAPSDANTVYALACDTLGGFLGLYQSTDAGSSFHTQLDKRTPNSNILGWSIRGTDPDGQGSYDLALAVDDRNKNELVVGGVNVWHSKDAGQTFKPVTYWLIRKHGIGLHADIHQVIQHPKDHSYFVCHDGGLSRSWKIIGDDPGKLLDDREASTQWWDYNQGMNITSFYRLGVNQANGKQLVAGAQDNSSYYTWDTTYTNFGEGDGMECLFDNVSNYMYISSQNGWVDAFKLVQDTFKYSGWTRPPNRQQAEWTTPFVTAKGKVYILYEDLYTLKGGDITSRITRFSDTTSETLPLVGTALAINETGSHFYLAKRGYASSKIENSFYTSNDSGKSWTRVGYDLPQFSYPSYIDLNEQNPTEAWITFSAFDSAHKVYHTKDGGKSWNNITYDLPNIPVNCIVHQNDSFDYTFIGTDLGVYYLKGDSSDSWTRYSTGLPNVIVSELEIDTNDQTLVAATFGRGIWEVPLIETTYKGNLNVRDQPMDNRKLSILSNPVQEDLTISMSNFPPGDLKLKIINTVGQTVYQGKININDAISTWSFDASQLMPGEYFITLDVRYSPKIAAQFLKL